jgi:hypothetical protein
MNEGNRNRMQKTYHSFLFHSRNKTWGVRQIAYRLLGVEIEY